MKYSSNKEKKNSLRHIMDFLKKIFTFELKRNFQKKTNLKKKRNSFLLYFLKQKNINKQFSKYENCSIVKILSIFSNSSNINVTSSPSNHHQQTHGYHKNCSRRQSTYASAFFNFHALNDEENSMNNFLN